MRGRSDYKTFYQMSVRLKKDAEITDEMKSFQITADGTYRLKEAVINDDGVFIRIVKEEDVLFDASLFSFQYEDEVIYMGEYLNDIFYYYNNNLPADVSGYHGQRIKRIVVNEKYVMQDRRSMLEDGDDNKSYQLQDDEIETLAIKMNPYNKTEMTDDDTEKDKREGYLKGFVDAYRMVLRELKK